MKPNERIQHYQRFWTIGLTIALILFGQFLTASAQTAKSKITTTGADDTYEPLLAQPAEFLQSMGLTPAQVQKKLKPRPHISVAGAGFVRNLGVTAFADLKNAKSSKSSIRIVGAGSAQDIGLVGLPGIQISQTITTTIQVVGAGSVRVTKLVAPPVQ